MRNSLKLMIAFTTLGCAACGGKKHLETTEAVMNAAAPVVAPIPPEPGSLWTASRHGSLYTDPIASRPGDLLTVIISEEARSTKNARTRTSRSSSADAGISGLFGLPAMAVDNFPGVAPSSLVKAATSNSFDGQGNTVRSGSLRAQITVTVQRVLPGGVLEVKGKRSVRVNGETEIITLTGIVRRQDILPDNTVFSSAVANAIISYTGKGIVSEKQRVGWLFRVMDWIWPF